MNIIDRQAGCMKIKYVSGYYMHVPLLSKHTMPRNLDHELSTSIQIEQQEKRTAISKAASLSLGSTASNSVSSSD